MQKLLQTSVIGFQLVLHILQSRDHSS